MPSGLLPSRREPHQNQPPYQCPRVRALYAAFPARSHLLPALSRSLRAASVFPTSLQLCSVSQKAAGKGD